MLEKIATKKILQDYHRVLYTLTGVAIDFIPSIEDAMTLCPTEHYNPLCHYLKTSSDGMKACTHTGRENTIKAQSTRKSIIYECHAGLIDIIVPLFINEQYIGCLTTGQILKKKPTEKTFSIFKKQIEHLNLNVDKLKEYYFHTVVMSDKQIEALAELINIVASYILETENKLFFLESVNEKKQISKVKEYIEQNYKKKLSIEKIADCIFLSSSHLSHMFKKEIGISPINYLNRFRIDKAKELLEKTNNSISEIAYSIGFQSLPHFNRIFKKMENKSPRLYRKSRIH